MDIGWAVEAARNGTRVTRPGWNGTGMWIAYEPGEDKPSPERDTDRYGACLMMRTADRAYVPWVASQTDLLAQDWTAL